jgi:hypothetical protein
MSAINEVGEGGSNKEEGGEFLDDIFDDGFEEIQKERDLVET